MQAALAAKLLEEEWPDQAVTAAARLAEREAATPVPERVWALRNVASTLVRPVAGFCDPGRAPHIKRLTLALNQHTLDMLHYLGSGFTERV